MKYRLNDILGIISSLEHSVPMIGTMTCIERGPEGKVSFATYGTRKVPWTGDVHPDVIDAFKDVENITKEIERKEISTNDRESEIEDLQMKHNEQDQLLQEAIWRQFPKSIGKTKMHVVHEYGLSAQIIFKEMILIDVPLETDIKDLWTINEAVHDLKKNIAELKCTQFNECTLLQAEKDHAFPMRMKKARHLLNKHHQDVESENRHYHARDKKYVARHSSHIWRQCIPGRSEATFYGIISCTFSINENDSHLASKHYR